ncbi:MAG: YhfC family intramembrane metalloprotease [Oscillospiraceae bacterium]|nr:YhfC family intramembrane metalloprotease [Oscillospiraceae bacterium]
MTVSTETIISLIVGGLLAIILPVAAVIIYKLRRRYTWVVSAMIGAGTFLVFALVLEQLLHRVMLPVVSGNKVLYCIYGCLAAGVFEETGRFVAYKLFMKKHHTAQNAVMMGLGHGGFEAMALAGVGLLSNALVAVSVNAVGYDAFVRQSTAGNAELAAAVEQQIETIAGMDFGIVALSLFERLIAVTFHVCMSVIVYKSTEKGRLRLFPIAILLHALLDSAAVMYQVGAIGSLITVYSAMVIMTAAVAVPTYKIIGSDRRRENPR